MVGDSLAGAALESQAAVGVTTTEGREEAAEVEEEEVPSLGEAAAAEMKTSRRG